MKRYSIDSAGAISTTRSDECKIYVSCDADLWVVPVLEQEQPDKDVLI